MTRMSTDKVQICRTFAIGSLALHKGRLWVRSFLSSTTKTSLADQNQSDCRNIKCTEKLRPVKQSIFPLEYITTHSESLRPAKAILGHYQKPLLSPIHQTTVKYFPFL